MGRVGGVINITREFEAIVNIALVARGPMSLDQSPIKAADSKRNC